MICKQTEINVNREAIMMSKTMRLSTITAAMLALTGGLIFLFADKTPAQGTDLLVVVSDGIKPSVEELTPKIEISFGPKPTPQFIPSKFQKKKTKPGDPFDA